MWWWAWEETRRAGSNLKWGRHGRGEGGRGVREGTAGAQAGEGRGKGSENRSQGNKVLSSNGQAKGRKVWSPTPSSTYM